MGTKDGKDGKDDKDKKNINMMRVRSTLANMYTVLCVVLIVIGMISLIAVLAGIRPFVMISESMHPEVPKNSLVLLDTASNVTDVEIGDNVGYVLGKVEAMHKVVSTSPGSHISTSPGSPVSNESANPGAKAENESAGKAENLNTEVGGVGANRTLVVKSLADDGESVVTRESYLGKEILSIPQVGGWIRKALDYKWIVIVMAGVLIIAGCIPRKKATASRQVVPEQS